MNQEEEYFQSIEDYFLQKRGNPMLLTPKEWALIREWYEAGIPREVVLRGIDRAFELKAEQEEHQGLSLRYCRRLVKSEHKRYLKAVEGQSPAESNEPEGKNVGDFLQRLVQFLADSSVASRQSGNLALAEFLEEKRRHLCDQIQTPFLQNQSTDLQRVEQQLTYLEKEIEQFLLQTISGEQMEKFKEEAMRELKTFQEKIDLPVYQEMVRRSLIKSARKLYSIPRLSLFYM